VSTKRRAVSIPVRAVRRTGKRGKNEANISPAALTLFID
jgi:hypothetical protein